MRCRFLVHPHPLYISPPFAFLASASEELCGTDTSTKVFTMIQNCQIYPADIYFQLDTCWISLRLIILGQLNSSH